jgi:hypothetical protein
MTLLLNGEKIRGKGLKVTANLRIESSDMSGQTSNTAQAHKGFKPKTLTVSLTIPFRDEVQLQSLMRLAQSTAAGGQLTVYRVVNNTAAAFGIRQVQFSENVSVSEDGNLRAWQVQFSLCEKLSVPERVEQRSGTNPVNKQGAPGEPALDANGNPVVAELDGFERVLKTIDDYLKPKEPAP